MTNKFLDDKTFEELFRLHFNNLTGFVFGYVRDEDVAKDIVHDVFLTLWNNRDHLDFSYSAKAYLFTLAHNYAQNYIRHLRVVEVNEREIVVMTEAFAGELVEYEEYYVRLDKKMLELPDKQRAVLLKCVVEGKKYQEVADELGVSLNTIKKHMSRALKFLRDELQEGIIALFMLRS